MPNILIVDDDPAILEILRAYLKAEGHTVLEALDGYSAREQLPALTWRFWIGCFPASPALIWPVKPGLAV